MLCVLFLLITAEIFTDASDENLDYVLEDMNNPLNIGFKPETAHHSSEGFSQDIDYFSGGIRNINPISVMDTREIPFDFSSEVKSDAVMYQDDGCRRSLVAETERRCLDEFERSVIQSQSISNDREKKRKICCVIVDYEKCSFRGYEEANCRVDEEEVRNHIIGVGSFFHRNKNCEIFRGQCHLISSSRAITLSWIALLPLGLMLI